MSMDDGAGVCTARVTVSIAKCCSASDPLTTSQNGTGCVLRGTFGASGSFPGRAFLMRGVLNVNFRSMLCRFHALGWLLLTFHLVQALLQRFHQVHNRRGLARFFNWRNLFAFEACLNH